MNQSDIDWNSLIKGVIENDPQSLNNFVEFNQQALMRFCLYLTGNKQLAEDICHDAFVKGITSIKQLKKPGQARAWLKQIARNLFLDYCKASAQSKTHVDINDIGHELSVSPDATDQQILAMQALQTLDEEDRTIVIMIDIEGHSYSEVSEHLKMKEGTVKSRVSRARQKMLEFIETFQSAGSSKTRKPEVIN